MTTNRMGLEQALSDEQSLRYEQLLKDARMFREAYESASEIIKRKERHIEQLEAVIKMHKPTRSVTVPDEVTFEQAMLEVHGLSPVEAFQKAWSKLRAEMLKSVTNEP